MRYHARAAVTRADDVDHIQIIVFDQPVQMNVEEIQSGCCAPMAEQTGFDVFNFERSFQQRIVLQIDLSDGKVIRRAPIGVHFAEEVG